MGKVIAIVNQKGGVAKTTTAINTGAGLANAGKKVLLIDLDPQGSLTKSLAVDIRQSENTGYELLKGSKTPSEVIRNLPNDYDLIPGDNRLSIIENRAGNDLLKKQLAPIVKAYDYILIDCSPSLGVLTINALTACNEVYIPLQAEYLALAGIAQLLQVVKVVQKDANRNLKVTGVIITMYDRRRRLTGAVEGKLQEMFPEALFATRIRNNVALAEAPIHGQDIFAYDPKSNGAKDYKALVNEIMERGNNNGK